MTGILRRGFTRRDAWRTSAAYATGLSAIAGFGLPAFAQSEDADKIVADMVAANPDKFNLSKIPEITNKDKITVVVESGFWSDYLKTAMIPKFTEKTGVEVEVVGMSTNVMYAKQQVELLGDTGGYDVLSMEAAYVPEWAANGFVKPLYELASEYDSAGVDGMAEYLEPFYAGLMTMMTYEKQPYSIPYNNYTQGLHYRADLLEHPDERKAFAEKYGYPLTVPTTFAQLIDIAAFFTRKAGENAAGKPLEKDLYGVALMAGRNEQINDEFSAIIWGMGGDWFRSIYAVDGTLEGFEVTIPDRISVTAAQTYLELLKSAPPAAMSWDFPEAANAMAEGQVAMVPFMFNNLWPVTASVETKFPGTRAKVATVPGGRPYTGAYGIGVAHNANNPEAAYWFVKYLTSYEGQMAYALGGGNPCRRDVVLDPFFQTEERRLTNGAYAQNDLDTMAWTYDVAKKGHFTSTAMGKIYSELAITCAKIVNKEAEVEAALQELAAKIVDIQGRSGNAKILES
ncbi:MAG TPA: extracellular solute-binding protein [Geminicoccus sp.]|uniref:extracellular solute-binding protein n=1 Tax=Geminicoccus sp. TaxID=2024832 RepID=UPI002CD4C10A|nr:extracellular solute-binding protein [Geminicoccus sp.]HWL67826.1 extracellular solute-binding protein [Geminicoccus sp.]